MRLFALALALTLNISACSPSEDIPTPPMDNTDTEEIPDNSDTQTSNTMRITINSAIFTATLSQNATAKAFKAMLPMTINMSEINNNEKYYYLTSNLPTAPSNQGTIQEGDIMLYGSNCLVVFYKTFSTSHSYTTIGKVDNPAGFQAALGTGNILVKFEQF